MADGDQSNGGNAGWVSPGQEPQDAVPQGYVPQPPPYPQYPSQYPQPGGQYPQPGNPQFYPPQQPYPQQPYPQHTGWPTVPQRPGAFRSGSSATRVVILVSITLAVLVVGIVIALVAGTSSSGTPAAAGAVQTSSAPESAAPQPSADSSSPSGVTPLPCSTAASISSEPIGYHVCGTAARSVGVPVYNAAPAHKTYTVTIKTNRGNIVFTANGNAAPYTVYSFVYLIEKQYFDNTDCTRVVTAEIYVLQCGDPTGTGSGAPGYAFQDENLASLGTPGSNDVVTYKAGVVAMANAGPGTNGSQFFLVYKDSPIGDAYTPFGTITQGLSIIQQVAKAGSDDRYGTGDGAPIDQVHIESVTESLG